MRHNSRAAGALQESAHAAIKGSGPWAKIFMGGKSGPLLYLSNAARACGLELRLQQFGRALARRFCHFGLATWIYSATYFGGFLRGEHRFFTHVWPGPGLLGGLKTHVCLALELLAAPLPVSVTMSCLDWRVTLCIVLHSHGCWVVYLSMWDADSAL